MSELSRILAQARRRRTLSQEELAARCGVSLSTVTRAEQGRAVPSGNSLRHLAAELGHDPQLLVSLGKKERRLPKIPGVITGDQLPAFPTLPLPTLPQRASVPHYGSVSAVQTDSRDEIAGEFSELPGVDFTVTVDGQCMEPRYENGERLGCSIARWMAEGFVWGKDYWIRFTDGQTTLKRVRPDPRHRDKIRCTPLNPKARPFSRLKVDVEKAARVLMVLAV